MKKVIGKVTTYHGTEHPYLTGYKVRIVAVMRNSMKPGIEDDDPEQDYIRDEDELARSGGVTIFDRIEVQPWLEKEGRFSFVTSDPRAQDLACFKHLANGQWPISETKGRVIPAFFLTPKPEDKTMNKALKKKIEELNELRLPELQARFAEVVGEETRAPNKTFLIRKIVTALESQAAREKASEATVVPAKTKKSKKSKTAVEDRGRHESESTEQKNDLSVEQLRERYREVVGRETGSHIRRYLMWKIRQAEQGKIPVGPTRTRRGDGVGRDFKVLPVRMEADLVEKLDEAWKRQGLKSRMELFRVSLRMYLSSVGEDTVAGCLDCEPGVSRLH